MALENKYIEFLGEIASSGPTIQMLALADLTGALKCLIHQPTPSKPVADFSNAHVFLGWAVAQSFVQLGSYYDFNNLQIVMIEYHRGTLLLAPLETNVLVLLVDTSTSVEFVRQKLPIYAQELSKLEETIETRPVTIRNDLLSELDFLF